MRKTSSSAPTKDYLQSPEEHESLLTSETWGYQSEAPIARLESLDEFELQRGDSSHSSPDIHHSHPALSQDYRSSEV